MDSRIWLLFAVTTAVVNLSPGPTSILMASRGATDGLGRTLFALLGACGASAIYFGLSATGIASLIVASNALFQVIKWVGVAYLLYLGLTTFLGRSDGLAIAPGAPGRTGASLFGQGFLVEFSNPKALLYFSAVLPQFLDAARPVAPQFLTMWATSLALQCAACCGYAWLGERFIRGGVRRWVVRAINRVAGGALIFAGLKMTSVSANR